MIKINAKIKNLIINATKICGADAMGVMDYILEDLTPEEFKNVRSFLSWSFTKKKYFGHGNFQTRVAEFNKSVA